MSYFFALDHRTPARCNRTRLFSCLVRFAPVAIFLVAAGAYAQFGAPSYLPLHVRFWGWMAIVALPLLLSLFRPRRSLSSAP